MKTFAQEQEIMSRPRRSLIGSYFGEKILLATPLLTWYLEHGLEVTHIYQVVEYTAVPCFQSFGEAVSDARRAGEADKNKAIIADTMKLVSCDFIKEKIGWNYVLKYRKFISMLPFLRWAIQAVARRSRTRNAIKKSSFVKK